MVTSLARNNLSETGAQAGVQVTDGAAAEVTQEPRKKGAEPHGSALHRHSNMLDLLRLVRRQITGVPDFVEI
jgi:hypothetical protein